MHKKFFRTSVLTVGLGLMIVCDGGGFTCVRADLQLGTPEDLLGSRSGVLLVISPVNNRDNGSLSFCWGVGVPRQVCAAVEGPLVDLDYTNIRPYRMDKMRWLESQWSEHKMERAWIAYYQNGNLHVDEHTDWASWEEVPEGATVREVLNKTLLNVVKTGEATYKINVGYPRDRQ
jgi:hypothetical protein